MNNDLKYRLIGRKFRDEDVMAAAYTYEQLNPWTYDIPLNRKIDAENTR